MRAAIVVVVTPSAKRLARMGEATEDLFIEKLIAQAPIETFDEGILRGLAGCDVMPVDGVIVLPFEHSATGKFCSIVADNHGWLAIEVHERIEFPGNAQAVD